MRSILIAVIACVGLGLISAVIPPNVIEADLAQINSLSQQLVSVTPAAARQFTETTCQIIAQCCPQLQPTFASAALQGKSQEIFQQCFGGQSSQAMQNMQRCAPMNQLRTITQDSQFQKFVRVASNAGGDSQNKRLIATTCSSDELHAIACDSQGTQLHDSCQRKVLQRLAQESDASYQGQVQQIKNNLNTMISKISSSQ